LRLYPFVLGGIALEISWYLLVRKRLRMAALSYTETTNAQDAQEEAMRNSSGVSEVASARARVLSSYCGALALSAATWGAPLVTMYALRYHDAVGPDERTAAVAHHAGDSLANVIPNHERASIRSG
jgi:hypothetical protein